MRTRKRLLAGTRGALCNQRISSNGLAAELGADGRAYYSGLIQCGHDHDCPNCAALAGAEHVARTRVCLKAALDAGSSVAFLTWTMAHSCEMPLAEGYRIMSQAQRTMRNSRQYKLIAAELGFGERMYGAEETYGGNGWHVHRHELLELCGAKSSYDELTSAIRTRLAPLWVEHLRRAGGSASEERGLKVEVVKPDDEDAVNRYINKFSEEAAGKETKRARRGGRTVWDLLDDSTDAPTEQGRKFAAARFVEFSEASAGRQRVWFSPGWRKLKPEIESDGLAEREVLAAVTICAFTWRWIRYFELEVSVLETLESGGAAACRAYVLEIEQRGRELPQYLEIMRSYQAEEMQEPPRHGWVLFNTA